MPKMWMSGVGNLCAKEKQYFSKRSVYEQITQWSKKCRIRLLKSATVKKVRRDEQQKNKIKQQTLIISKIL